MKSYIYDAGEPESNIHVSDCHPLEMIEKEKFDKVIIFLFRKNKFEKLFIGT